MPSLQSLSSAPLLSIVALLITVLTLWLSPRVTLAAAAVTIAVGYIAAVMHGPAALWLLVVGASAWWLRTARGWVRLVAIAITGVVGLLLGLHLLPGFANPIVMRDAMLASDAIPYTQYVNFDKTLAAVLLLACSGWTPLRSIDDWYRAITLAAPWTVATVLVVMAASLALGFVRFDPRGHQSLVCGPRSIC